MTATIIKTNQMEIMEIIDKDLIEIKRTTDTPEVILNRNEGIIKFSGRSLPENPREFYNPIKRWLANYAENPSQNTHLVLNMDYFNTASSKMIMEIVEITKECEKAGSSLRVDWYYLEDDEEMLEAGQEFADITETVFNYFPYE